MLFPAFASIRGKLDNRRNLREAIRLATRYACFTIIPLDLLLLATAKPSITLLVGNAYVSGAAPLAIFCAADAITVFATAVAPSLLALEETVTVGATTSLAVVVGIIIEYALMPHWGIIAASAGRAVIIILIAALQTLILRRKTPLQLDLRTVTRTLIAGGVMAVLVAVVQLIYYSKFLLPLYGLVGLVTYVVMLRLLRVVDRADVDLIRSVLGGRLSIVTRFLGWVLLPAERRNS
jgi:O-antigen/teichoic acid export membrane protein